MFREPSTTTEVIIEIIRSLPEKEQAVIVKSITEKKKPAKKAAKEGKAKKTALNPEYEQMEKFLKRYRGRLPKGYKFDREEANAR